MRPSVLFSDFLKSEKTGGLLLIGCTVLSLLLANSSVGADYQHFWHTNLGSRPIEFWINDGLMAVFFLLIGLELKREIYTGALSRIKDATFPIFAALGGMLIPAGIYMVFNFGTATQSGAGIPMATDIAFALGILSLLGNKVPTSLKVFLTALAVIDDLGAILVIAFFYTQSMSFVHLLIAFGVFLALLALNRFKVRNLLPYLLGGIVMWYFMLHSGIHATISGVLLAFAIPFGPEGSVSHRLEHHLHKPVNYLVLPLFALANTAIVIGSGIGSVLGEPQGIGIALGLIIGKPVGIFLFGFAAAMMGWCRLPLDLNWKMVFGVGFLGGIGFTMSIFIALLAFDDPRLINDAKLVILIASLVAGTVGYLLLRQLLKHR